MRRLRVFVLLLISLIASSLLPGGALGATDKLPDLGIMRPNQFHLDTTTQPGRRLLRFNTRIANAGPGLFKLVSSRDSTASQTMKTVVQQIEDSAGGSRSINTVAVLEYASDGHNHWHVRNLQQYRLTPVGGGTGRVGSKTGFCFYDNTVYDLTLVGAPQSPQYFGCGGISDLAVTMGLSVGWADKYSWKMADQWVDITGLASGRYRLTITADPQNWFVEANESNNFAWTELDIRSTTVTVVRNSPRF